MARPEVASNDGPPATAYPRSADESSLSGGVSAPRRDAPPPRGTHQKCSAGHFGRTAAWVDFQKYLLGFRFVLVMRLRLGATFTHTDVRRLSEIQPSWGNTLLLQHILRNTTPLPPLLTIIPIINTLMVRGGPWTHFLCRITHCNKSLAA